MYFWRNNRNPVSYIHLELNLLWGKCALCVQHIWSSHICLFATGCFMWTTMSKIIRHIKTGSTILERQERLYHGHVHEQLNMLAVWNDGTIVKVEVTSFWSALVPILCDEGWRLAHLGFGQMAFQTSKKLRRQTSGLRWVAWGEENYFGNIAASKFKLYHLFLTAPWIFYTAWPSVISYFFYVPWF